ncbi:hypothetical protein B0T14DRAFT_569510 [Immersiella caudata]|uniref:Uncharacterized protein n=1 Tax=Immersiella caudata TaxID=314043 RepID=A0AA39WDN1_9PEZI|nr:hypothetical protein B0T14DRAFT_569510 [Immersiella caudata]
MAEAAAAPYLGRLLASRWLKVRVTPLPVALAERRAILHALKQQAEIEHFKQSQDDHVFQIQTADPSGADKLCNISPLELEYRPDEHRDGLGPIPPPNPAKSTSEAQQRRTFRLHISPSKYPHATATREHGLHGPWPNERSPFEVGKIKQDSLVLNALGLSVPESVDAFKGLRDWDTYSEVPPFDAGYVSMKTKRLHDRSRKNGFSGHRTVGTKSPMRGLADRC